jgi:hypothetical protein
MQQSFFTAYWSKAKHPKSLGRVIQDIYKDDNAPKPEVNVDKFLERKRRFEALGGFNKENCTVRTFGR